MRINNLKRELGKLKRTIENQPRVWRFRGRRVVNADEWKWGDWTKLPDDYHVLIVWGTSVPADYFRDFIALMEKLENPRYGRDRCWNCSIHQAQRVKEEIDRDERYWQKQEGKEKFYEWVGEAHARTFRKQDSMRQVEWCIYNELPGANNRTCDVMNYFHCPCGDGWRQLLKDGYDAHRLWDHIKWYDRHWNLDPSSTPPTSELKWYHYNEPPIIDVTNYDDVTRAIEDDRLDKIIDEHTR